MNTNRFSADSINARIRQVRKQAGLTQHDFALRIGILQPSLSQIEKAVIAPSLKVVRAVANEFSISYAWLLDGAGPMEQQQATAPIQPDGSPLALAPVVSRQHFSAYAQGGLAQTGPLQTMAVPGAAISDTCVFEVPNDTLDPALAEGDLALCSPVAHATQIMAGQHYVLVGTQGVEVVRVLSNLYWQHTLVVADDKNRTGARRINMGPDSTREVWHVFARLTMRLNPEQRLAAAWPATEVMPQLLSQGKTMEAAFA